MNIRNSILLTLLYFGTSMVYNGPKNIFELEKSVSTLRSAVNTKQNTNTSSFQYVVQDVSFQSPEAREREEYTLRRENTYIKTNREVESPLGFSRTRAEGILRTGGFFN
eukprot:GDKJ01009178.1.p1 GENE.GDKJ01009178.1~~GDKJ01009178.1.p1  ORF type:complete len:109 (-),score=3.95 GDKJ01009178.1:59-385(-)